MIILRTNTGMPPGGFQFQDPRVPGMIWNDTHSFMDDRVREVVRFRSANPTIYDPKTDSNYLNPALVRQEIAAYNCARLGNNPIYCYDADAPVPQKATAESKCSCGVQLEPRYCPTCGGNKLIGYRCPKCNALYDL